MSRLWMLFLLLLAAKLTGYIDTSYFLIMIPACVDLAILWTCYIIWGLMGVTGDN